MYILQFKKNKSKYFQEALDFAKDFNCEFDGKIVTISIPDEHIFSAYSMMRQLFSFIQNWKGTTATFRGKPVHPYRFILYAHGLSQCQNEFEYDPKNCLDNYDNVGWGCYQINNILYDLKGNGNYKKNGQFWYNYGYFKNEKWIIDKELLLSKILNFINEKGIDICELFDENKVRFAINNLPTFIIPDNKTFRIHFVERYVNGEKVQIPNNVRHISKQTVPGRLAIPIAFIPKHRLNQ